MSRRRQLARSTRQIAFGLHGLREKQVHLFNIVADARCQEQIRSHILAYLQEMIERFSLEQIVATAFDFFYITLRNAPELDSKYTVFGRVITGMAVADRLQRGDMLKRASVKE